MPSNDPQSLLTSGNCLLCYNLTLAQAAEIQLLINSLQGGGMTPCVPPLPPLALSVGSQSATTITFSFAAPIPAPTVGYIIRWGTTPGGPYPNSKTWALADPKTVSNTDGLVADTDYYFVLYSNNGNNCLSATSSNEIAGALLDPVVASFDTRLQANGAAALTNSEKNALQIFVRGMKSDGIWTKMIAVNVLMNKGLIGVRTPLLAGGGNDPWGNNGYVAGNLNADGLLGVVASSTCLTTGILPSAVYASKDDAGLSVYVSLITNTAGFEIGRFGSVANSTYALSVNFSDNKTRFDAWENATLNGETQVAAPNKAGFYSASRTPANTAKIYFANSTNAFAQVGATNNNAGFGTFSDVDREMTMGAITTAAGTILNPTDRRMSYCAIHFGLTSAQTQLEYNRVQALRTALGGGFA